MKNLAKLKKGKCPKNFLSNFLKENALMENGLSNLAYQELGIHSSKCVL